MTTPSTRAASEAELRRRLREAIGQYRPLAATPRRSEATQPAGPPPPEELTSWLDETAPPGEHDVPPGEQDLARDSADGDEEGPDDWSSPAGANGRAVARGHAWAGRVQSFTRQHLAAVGIVLACALAFTSFHLLRAGAREIPLAVTPLPGSSSPITPAAPASPAAAATVIRVHVIGKVRRPGVVSLPPGARVADAIEAAGGLAPGAVPGDLNLAAVVADGSQVVIAGAGQPASTVRPPPQQSAPPATQVGASAPAASAGPLLNLNTATADQLDGLPGVGPVTAQRILAWRTQHGRFTAVSELQEVEGIGPKTYAQIAPLVTV